MPRINVGIGSLVNLDAAITTRASASDMALVLARLPSVGIAAVEFGSIAIASGTTGTATISSVDTTRAAVMFLGDNGPNTTGANDRNRVALTNATTVTATRIASGAITTTVAFCVITFTGVVSLQQGTTAITTTNLTGTTTITAVASGRAIMVFGGCTVAPADDRDVGRATLTNTTTVTATRAGSGVSGTTTVGWTVIEF